MVLFLRFRVKTLPKKVNYFNRLGPSIWIILPEFNTYIMASPKMLSCANIFAQYCQSLRNKDCTPYHFQMKQLKPRPKRTYYTYAVAYPQRTNNPANWSIIIILNANEFTQQFYANEFYHFAETPFSCRIYFHVEYIFKRIY